MVNIMDAFKYYMIDRESCYEDLTMMVQMTGYGLTELRKLKEDGKTLTVTIDKIDESITDIVDTAVEDIRKPFFPTLLKEVRDGMVWFFLGVAGGITLILMLQQ